KFHSPDCANLPSPKNAVEFSSYQAAIDAGFTPCSSCLK
ncbi:MAG TPA: MBL fold hydrolase, partial [Clostridiales bacterium]|nr:MBL fold hydrolase [Clostridiales bacterium]